MEFINLKDRLPENDQKVLAYSEISDAIFISQATNLTLSLATHWMPLPEPPGPKGPFGTHCANGRFFLCHEKYGPIAVDLRFRKRTEALADQLNSIWATEKP